MPRAAIASSSACLVPPLLRATTHHMNQPRLALVIALLSLHLYTSAGQTTVSLSGLVYIDYEYTLAAPAEEAEGQNGFGYRRLYLTSDFGISEEFSARARLEAHDGSTTAQGRPAPFIKDLYLKWEDAFAEGHDLYIGISPPPSFTVSERIWGFRSLERTIQDRTGVVSSRDFGVALRGPLSPNGAVRYGVMAANNNGVGGESDKHKRVYGQLEIHPGNGLVITVGADYASFGDDRDDAVNGNAMVAHSRGRVTVGLEGFYYRASLAGLDETDDLYGLAAFGRANVNDKITLVGRFDRVEMSAPGVEDSENFFLAGVSIRPHENVDFIPNVIVSKLDSDDGSFVAGRVTLHVDF